MVNQKHAMAYGLAAVLLWSTVATAFKLALASLAPVQVLLVACSSSVLVLALVLWLQGRWRAVFRLRRAQYAQSLAWG